MHHKIILLGDSIFDNAPYVENYPVITQLCGRLPAGSSAELLAVDGSVTTDVREQVSKIPQDATHLVVSCGGNDALRRAVALYAPSTTVFKSLAVLADIKDQFAKNYKDMLDGILAKGLPTAVCTIYDQVPGVERELLCALSVFNDVIVKTAALAKVPVLDIRTVCTSVSDYSLQSPIEPSEQGGDKIVSMILEHVFAAKY